MSARPARPADTFGDLWGKLRSSERKFDRHFGKAVNGKHDCAATIDVARLGDPAPRCAKNFIVEYSCDSDPRLLREEVPSEAGLGSVLKLSCSPSSIEAALGLRVRSATYGGSCGVRPGNATADLAKFCDFKHDCEYTIDVARLSDPAPRCQKDFSVEYSCGSDPGVMRENVPGEAGLGSAIRLRCSGPALEIPASGPPSRAAGLRELVQDGNGVGYTIFSTLAFKIFGADLHP